MSRTVINTYQETHQEINQIIANFLKHPHPSAYTEDIELAWQSLVGLQDLGYGFSMMSLGRNNLQVRVIKWSGGEYSGTATGEYIINVVDNPAPLAICRAVVATLKEEGITA